MSEEGARERAGVSEGVLLADDLLAEREKNHLLQEEVETTLKDLQSM